MKTPRFVLTSVLFTLLAALPAMAGPRTFVSGLGNDANPGTREQPKRTFASALTVTNPGGQIVALDSAGYASSTLTINKSVSIIVPPGVAGFITVSGANDGIRIDAASTDVVSIRGLIIERTSPDGFAAGIDAPSVGTLTVEDCAVRKFNAGIFFSQLTAAHLRVHGGSVRQNGYGIYVSSAGGAHDAIVTDCLVENNDYGFQAIQGNTRITIGDCTISGNDTGVITSNAAQLISLGNNSFVDNGTDGSFTGTKARK